jgi:ribosome-associated translation inhibitor RaiA
MQEPVQIAFHGVDHSPAVEARIREKVAKLDHLFDRATACRVVIEHLHRSRSNLTAKDQPFRVSVELDVPGATLVAGKDSKSPDTVKAHADINAAIADTFGIMERRLKEYVDRRWRDHRAKAS